MSLNVEDLHIAIEQLPYNWGLCADLDLKSYNFGIRVYMYLFRDFPTNHWTSPLSKNKNERKYMYARSRVKKVANVGHGRKQEIESQWHSIGSLDYVAKSWNQGL